jgi:hypothetical protein
VNAKMSFLSKLSTKQKAILIGITIALIVILSAATVIAVTSWSGTRTYTKPAKSFTVDKATTLDYGIVDTATETFTVTNTGNQPITITPSASVSPTGSATATWNTPSAVIPAGPTGNTATFTLSLTITASGSVSISFAMS